MSREVRFAAVYPGEMLPPCSWFEVFGVTRDEDGRWTYHIAYEVEEGAKS
jgi:hypothetical protein